MLAKKLEIPREKFSKPEDAAWHGVSALTVGLTGTPLAMQPSPYIIASRAGKPIGKVKQVEVKALHNGQQIAFRLHWEDPERDLEQTDNDTFADGAALLFPLRPDSPLITMGAPGKPVTAWHWRADRPLRARNNVAAGLGSTRVTKDESITVYSGYEQAHWSVVFVRDLRVPAATDDAIQFSVGANFLFGVAVWEGANGERAGLKAFSPAWQSVELQG